MKGVLVMLVTGVALLLSAVAGASSATYPQFTVFYWLAAAGITMVIAGALTWASEQTSR
jgi:hypothetical protein